MNHYCTYFNRGYLAQGVALWQSLVKNDSNFQLTVLALDDVTAHVLRAFTDDRLDIVDLNELLAADRALAALQATRSPSEFIFSMTPCFVRYVFDSRPEIERIAYVDADLFFFDHSASIWNELGDNSVLVVPHRYPRWHDDSAYYGRYNVGVVIFRRDDSGCACVDWWREQCLASTSLVADGDHYGDQKYLDEWPHRFARVVESRHPGINVAPWNWAGHRFEIDQESIRVDGAPLIVFHFAQFKRISRSWFDSGQLEYGIMPHGLRKRIYGEYWNAILEAEILIQGVRSDFIFPRRGWKAALGPWHLALLRIFWGQFWWHTRSGWFAGRIGLGRWSGHVMARYRHWRRAT